MRIISRKTLRVFWEKPEYADAKQPPKAWFREASNADWASLAAIKAALAMPASWATTAWCSISAGISIDSSSR